MIPGQPIRPVIAFTTALVLNQLTKNRRKKNEKGSRIERKKKTEEFKERNLMRKAFVNGGEDVKSGAGNAGLVRMISHGRRNRIASNPRYPCLQLCSSFFSHFFPIFYNKENNKENNRENFKYLKV